MPRGRNVLHTIFEKHFKDFCDLYEEQYAERYGKLYLAHTMDVAEHFTEEVLLKLSALGNPAPLESRPPPSMAPEFGGELSVLGQ